jgi:hypothetical protein
MISTGNSQYFFLTRMNAQNSRTNDIVTLP